MASPEVGAASAGWLDSAQRDLKQREYELSWQASPVVNDVEASWHAPNRQQRTVRHGVSASQLAATYGAGSTEDYLDKEPMS